MRLSAILKAEDTPARKRRRQIAQEIQDKEKSDDPTPDVAGYPVKQPSY